MNLKTLYFFLISLLLFSSCKDKANKANNQNEVVGSSQDHKFTNALIEETSPYLLQHAHNPVDWMPWGQKAFDLAKEQNKLVVVSIGYSSCHWCFVMEQESFEDEEVAKLMNENYINIKVDRDERPDVDAVYQTALQMVNGFGGWPLNAIILPDGKPIYLGTYHEKDNWMAVLSNFSKEYVQNPEKIREYAAMLAEGVRETYQLPNTGANNNFEMESISSAITQWSKIWDTEWGGDVAEQKFVVPSKMELLLDYGILTANAEATQHFKKTLDIIAMSGLYDHLGGGFFRYTTDREWKVPHFEKMLYDNAQLLGLFARAYSVFKDPQYKNVVEMTFGFLQREMKSPEGGYYSSMDASIDGKEGAFYTWETKELETILQKDYDIFMDYYGTTALDESLDGRYILYQKATDSAFTLKTGLTIEELQTKLNLWQEELFAQRQQREFPKKDDKIITSWNALLIDGFIEAYKAFGTEKYLKAAEETFAALRKHNFRNGQLLHSYKPNSTQEQVYLEDYAFMASCALNLYKMTEKKSYLDTAKILTEQAIENYTDPSGLFAYSNSDELIAKVVDKEDGVLPSSNAIMGRNLFELGHLDYNTLYIEQSKKMMSSVGPEFLKFPQNYGQWGRLLLKGTLPFYEIVVVGPEAGDFVKKINQHFLPNTIVVGSKVENDSFLFRNRYADGLTLVYICRDNTCKLPVKTVKEAMDQLWKLGYPKYLEEDPKQPVL